MNVTRRYANISFEHKLRPMNTMRMMMMMRMVMRMKMATRRRGSYAHNFCGNFNNLGEATINLEKEKFFSFKKKTKYQLALKGECF